MSQRTSARIPIPWPDVNVFAFGKSSLYGYDSHNHRLFVQVSIPVDGSTALSNDCLHLSSSPTWPIRRLIPNEDETMVALVADKLVYLVHLSPSSNDSLCQSPNRGSRFCPIVRVPSVHSSATGINCSSIDFVWLTNQHFAIVYFTPSSSSDCHLYAVRSSKADGVELLRTLSVGAPAKSHGGTPRKNISLHQPADVIKLDATKRQINDATFILLFALKTNGEIFALEIDEAQLLHGNEIHNDFHGPLRLLPSTFDNYGVTHSQSTLVSLAPSAYPLLVFAPSRSQLHHCMILSPSAGRYDLFTVDCVSSTNGKEPLIVVSIVADRFAANRYYISDLNANVHAVEITWLDQVQKGSKQLPATRVRTLIHGAKNEIEQMGCIQTNDGDSYVAVIVPSSTKEKTTSTAAKELILVHSNPATSNRRQTSTTSDAKLVEFLDRICSMLSGEQSIPLVTLPSSTATPLSDADLDSNLRSFIKSFTEQYINTQEKARQELANKQRYLDEFQAVQSSECKQLQTRFQQLQNRFQTLNGRYKQECARRQLFSSRTGDLLSTIEQSIPVLSSEEERMQKLLEAYQTQINVLEERMPLLRQFASFNDSQSQSEGLSLEFMQSFVRDHRSQIDHIKDKLENLQAL